jgi:hypothetical protein
VKHEIDQIIFPGSKSWFSIQFLIYWHIAIPMAAPMLPWFYS